MGVRGVVGFFGAWLLLGGCGGDDAPPGDGGVDGATDGAVDAEPSCTEYLWDRGAETIARWPEPDWIVDDATTLTGKRIAFSAEDYPGLEARSAGFFPVFSEDLAGLDGFGVNAQVFMMFGRRFDPELLPSGEPTGDPGAGVGLVVLEPGPARLEPVLVTTTDEGATLLLTPMHPLPSNALVAAFVTRELTDAARGCLEPSVDQAAELAAPSGDVSTAIAELTTLGVIEGAEDLVALVAYPTQAATAVSEAVAEDIAARSYALDAAPACVTETAWVRCEATFTAHDYRAESGEIDVDPEAVVPHGTYVVPVTFWLPKDGVGSAPYPTLVYGHGIGGGRDQAERLAEFAAPEGIATVAIDALRHGDHPTNENPGASAVDIVLSFFGFGDLATRAMYARLLRDNFRQSTYDKLQLTRILEGAPDLDGDSTPDIDPAKLGFLGVSLGGVMGPELLALSEPYRAGVLVVPGGRVASIINEGQVFGTLITLFRPATVTDGDIARFFPVLQTVIDASDGATYAAHLYADRFVGGDPPSVLMGVVLDDDTVPNESSWALARAMGLSLVPPELRRVPGIPVGGPVPWAGNVDTGTTAGLLQFDVIREGAEVKPATHSNVGDSEVGAEAWFAFLRAEFEDDLAEIIDPYAATGLDHAE